MRALVSNDEVSNNDSINSNNTFNADEEVHGTGWLVLLHIQPAYCLPKNVTER